MQRKKNTEEENMKGDEHFELSEILPILLQIQANGEKDEKVPF